MQEGMKKEKEKRIWKLLAGQRSAAKDEQPLPPLTRKEEMQQHSLKTSAD
jgi:hypothetical protein